MASELDPPLPRRVTSPPLRSRKEFRTFTGSRRPDSKANDSTSTVKRYADGALVSQGGKQAPCCRVTL